MKVKPLFGKILVKRLNAEEKTAGGIIIPDAAKEKPKQGEVIALGTGKRDKDGKEIPFTLKVGDRIMFTSYAPTEIKVDGEELLLMSEEDALCIVE